MIKRCYPRTSEASAGRQAHAQSLLSQQLILTTANQVQWSAVKTFSVHGDSDNHCTSLCYQHDGAEHSDTSSLRSIWDRITVAHRGSSRCRSNSYWLLLDVWRSSTQFADVQLGTGSRRFFSAGALIGYRLEASKPQFRPTCRR